VNTTDVIVVGAGPTGLMLACELAMRGVAVRLLEERRDMPNITRAFGVHARTLELLDARGMADEIVQRGLPIYEVAPARGAVLNLRGLRSRYPMVLMAPQSLTERVLSRHERGSASARVAAWVEASGKELAHWQRTLTDMRSAGAAAP